MNAHLFRVAAWGAVVVAGAARLPGGEAEPSAALSAEARKLIAAMKPARPVRIDAFVSPAVPESYAPSRQDLLAALRAVEAAGAPQVRVRVYETEWLSDEALRAEQRYGILPRQVTTVTRQGTRTDNLFLGLAVTCGVESAIVPFLDRQTPADYELVRAICAVAQPMRKRVGVLTTDVSLFGRFDARTMTATRKWPIIEELEKQYDVAQVDPAQPIAERCDVLLAVQPSSLGPEAMQNFVAAVEKGQPTLIFEDPFPMFAPDVAGTTAPRRPPGGANPMNPMFGPPPPKGDLTKLWALLGVEFAADRVVWQDYNPYVQLDYIPKEFVFVDAGSGAKAPFNAESPITAGIQHMLFPFPGAFAKRAGSSHAFAGLVRTGELTGTVASDEVAQPTPFGASAGLNPERRHTPTHTSYLLAARIGGPAAPADATRPKLDVVLVADIDMLHETFFRLREQGDLPESSVPLDFDNVAFVHNAVDVLGGDERFLALRRRRGTHPILARTPARIAEERRLADARQKVHQAYDAAVQEAQQGLRARIEAAQDRLRQENLTGPEAQSRLSLVQQDEQQRLEAKIAELRRQRDQHLYRIGRGLPAKPPARNDADDLRGEPLFPRFADSLAAASVEIVNRDAEGRTRRVHLVRADGRWLLESHFDYPADAPARLAAVITGLMRLTVLDSAGENVADHESLGALDPDEAAPTAAARSVGTRVTIKDSAGKALLALIVGSEVRGRPELRHVRRAGQIPAYIVKADAGQLSTRLADWIDDDLLGLKSWDIQRIEIEDYAIERQGGSLALDARSRMTLLFDDAGKPPWRLADCQVMAAGQWQAKPLAANEGLRLAALDDLKGALCDLRILDVARKPPKLAKDFEAGEAIVVNQEIVDSLTSRGFYPTKMDKEVKLYAQQGEIRVLMKDGMRFLLRIGDSDAPAPEDHKTRTPRVLAPVAKPNRWLLATADFDPAAIPPPRLEPLPAGGLVPSGDLQDRARIEKDNQRKQAEHQEQVAAGGRRAKQLNARFADWYYLVSDELCGKLRVGREQAVGPR